MLAINQPVYLPRQTSVDEVPSIWREIFAELRHCYRPTSDSEDGRHARHVRPGEKKHLKRGLFTSEARLRGARLVSRGGSMVEF